MDWFLVGTSQAKLDLEDLLEMYDPDPKELNVSPIEFLSDAETDIGTIADCGEGKLVGEICCVVEGTALASLSGIARRGWLSVSDLVGTGGAGVAAVGGVGGACAGWRRLRSNSLRSCETLGRCSPGRKWGVEDGSLGSGAPP